MTAHELATRLMGMPDVPVRLFTDHGQTSSPALQLDLHIYSENYGYSCQEWSMGPEDRSPDEIKIIEIYGE